MLRSTSLLVSVCAVCALATSAREWSQALGLGADVAPLCSEPCLECQLPETECRYGFHNNFCDELVCAKGPNETCGGLFDERGLCGQGLTCRCGVCTGCSSDTLDCYYRHCADLPRALAPPRDRGLVRAIAPSFLF